MTEVRTEYVEMEFKLKLRKDLLPNEVLCPECGGGTLQVDDSPYGLKGHVVPGKPFPYKHQSITGCSHCYNGVRKLCKYCDKMLSRSGQCDCNGYSDELEAKREETEANRWDRATKITATELMNNADKYPNMLFYENGDLFFSSMDSLVEHISESSFEDNKDGVPLSYINSLRVYYTYQTSAEFDVESILQDAVEELHEDAYTNIMYHSKEVEEFFAAFVEKVKEYTSTYMPDFDLGVTFSMEELEKIHPSFSA